MAESLEFGGGGEPFPQEGERVSPKIKMKTFPSLYVTLCIREWFKRMENSDAIQESKALIQTGKLGLRNYTFAPNECFPCIAFQGSPGRILRLV